MIEEILLTIARIRLIDLIDLLVVSALIYHVLLLIRGTRGWQMTVGAASLIIFYYLTKLLNLQAVGVFLDNFFTYFIFALFVIFQAEIRRGLARIGRGHFFKRFASAQPIRLDEIVLAATTLASQRIGGLVVVEREIGLRNYIESGIKLDAYLTYDLLVTIFNPKSPLHDGAVIIRGDRVSAAGCFLPLTLDPYLSKELGTRHRAAIGVARETDAIAVIVSEETGTISLCIDREIYRHLDGARLLRLLKRHLTPHPRDDDSKPQKEGSPVTSDRPAEVLE